MVAGTALQQVARSPFVNRIAPKVTGNVAADFAAYRDFFANTANGDRIGFPAGALPVLYSGAIRLKPEQVLDGAGAVITRANELLGTTTGTVANGATTIGVSNAAAWIPGMYVNLIGVDTVNGHAIYCYATADNNTPMRVLSSVVTNAPSAGNGTITLEAAISGIVDISVPGVDTPSNSSIFAIGATIASKGPLVDLCSQVAGAYAYAQNLDIVGNKDNNTTNNRWESTVELRMNTTHGGSRKVRMLNACGEGIVCNGTDYTLEQTIYLAGNGNGIHFNGQSIRPVVQGVYVDGCNLMTSVGHANGGVIASNNVYNTILRDIRVYNSRMAGIGSWDQSDNNGLIIEGAYIQGCWGPGLGIKGGTVGAPSTIKITDVDVIDCGISYIGQADVTSNFVYARNFQIENLRFYNANCWFGMLQDSNVQAIFMWDDSAALTPSSIAGGRATNFAGTGSVVGNQGVNVSAPFTFVPCERTAFDIRVVDGATTPVASTFGAQFVSTAGQGGAMVDCELNIDVTGCLSAIQINGVFQRCKGKLKVDGRWQVEAVNLFGRTYAASAAFPAASTNGIVGTVLTAGGSGGATIRTQYALTFSATNQTVLPVGYFIVDGGTVTQIVITRPGSYSSGTATLGFGNAPGLSGVTATAVMGATPDRTISFANKFTVDIHHAAPFASSFGLKVRQEIVNSAGCGLLDVGGIIRFDTTPNAGVIAVADTSGGNNTNGRAPLNVRLQDLELVGPSSGWTPFQLYNAALPSPVVVANPWSARVNNVRIRGGLTYNFFMPWIVEDGTLGTKAISAAYTASGNEGTILATTGSAYNVNLPPLVGTFAEGKGIVVEMKNLGAINAATWVADGSDLIDGFATLAVTGLQASRLKSIGTSWIAD